MRRRGFVLAAVLFALVLLAALTAAGFFAALQEYRAGANAAALLRVQTAASSAIAETIDGWDPLAMDSMRPGSTMHPAIAAVPGVAVQLEARRLSPSLFLLRAIASHASASRSVARVVRLRGFDFDPAVAARVRAVDPVLTARVDGVDRAPPGWNCPATSDTIMPLSVHNGVSDSIFFQFGNRDWPDLVAWAGRVPPGGDSLIIQYWPGNLALSGSRVTGILIVGGDLTLDAGAEIAGIVVVRGSVVLRGAGGTIRGAMVASQLIADIGYTSSQPVVAYSSCAVQSVAYARAWPEVLKGAPPVAVF